MATEPDVPSYEALTARLRRVLSTCDGELSRLGQVDGYPIYRADLGRPGAKRLLISAGIHGEEPAGVLGLADWLARRGLGASTRLGLTLLPCLNPFGFERGRRTNAAGLDPNRRWRLPADPLRRLVAEGLAGERFELVLDLHEDSDFRGFYLYEICRRPPLLGPRMVVAAGRVGPVAEEEEIEDGYAAQDGRVEPLTGDAIDAFVEEREEWPIAFYYCRHHSERVLTVETPGRQPLSLRTAMHGAVLDEAVAFLTARA